MSRNVRWTILIANGAAALGVIFFTRARAAVLPADLALPVEVEQQWLGGLLILYMLNAAAAWRFRNTYSVSAARMLVFAAAAFAAVSHGIDIAGENRTLLPDLFGVGADSQTTALIAQLQARIAAVAAMVALCLTAVAVGFESVPADE